MRQRWIGGKACARRNTIHHDIISNKFSCDSTSQAMSAPLGHGIRVEKSLVAGDRGNVEYIPLDFIVYHIQPFHLAHQKHTFRIDIICPVQYFRSICIPRFILRHPTSYIVHEYVDSTHHRNGFIELLLIRVKIQGVPYQRIKLGITFGKLEV